MSTLSSCPTAEQIEDLLANRLTAEQAEAIRQHLNSCPVCLARRNPSQASVSNSASPYFFLSPPRAAGEIGWLDHHRVLGVLGQGSMSIVFDAEDTQLGRRVALKILKPSLSDATTRERFLREGRLIAGLPHEHIVTVFQVGEANGVPYLSMERLEGESLEDRLQRDRWLPLAEALALTREAAEGLLVAHEAGLVHRDIKPANLWLESKRGQFRRVKLIDFGIARLVNQNTSLTLAGQVLGTPMYMAPEQAAGKPVDGRADLYSLGGVLFHMLTGKPPFQGRDSNTMALLHAVITGDAPVVQEEAPQLPVAVAELIQQLLSRDPEQRPANARALVEKLRQLEERAAQQPLSLTPSVRPSLPRRLMRRPGLLGITVGILAITAALVVSALAIYHRFSPSRREDPEDPPAVTGVPLKIGVIHSLTGTLSLHETHLVLATQLAVEEINEAGGVQGRPLQMIVEDGASEEATFADKARKLIEQDRVDVLFGCWTSSSRKRVAEVCQQHDRLLFYPTIHEGLENSSHVVYLGGTPNQTLLPLVRWAYADKGKRRFFLLGSEAVYSHAVGAIMQHQIDKLGAKVVGERYAPFGETDFAQVVAEIQKQKADLLINTMDGQSNLALFRALRAAGLTSEKLPTVWVCLSETELSQFPIEPMRGDYGVGCYFESLPAKENRAFVERVRQRFGATERVNDAMETAYFGVYLWKKAVEQASSTETEKVRHVLRGLVIDAPEGPIQMDETNQHAYRTARIGEIVRGNSRLEFRLLYSTPEPIRADPFPNWRTPHEWNQFLQKLYLGWNDRWEKHR